MASGVASPGNIADPVWQDRSVLITGCTGFLGCWIARHLCDRGARVTGIALDDGPRTGPFTLFGLRDRVTLVMGALDDYTRVHRTVAEYDIETVFHLAAQSQVGVAKQFPRETMEANVQGTWNVLEAVRATGRKAPVVIASSDAVYGDSGELPYTETSPVRGLFPYDVSKLCAEAIALMYQRTYAMPVCIARTSNLYGGGDANFQRIVPGTVCSVLRGETPVIRSTGLAERDYLYIEDAVAAYVGLASAMARQELGGEIFNFSADRPVSVLEIVKTILNVAGRGNLSPEVLGQVVDEVPVKHSSSAKAKEKLGWSVEVSLEAGLKKTIEWYREAAVCLQAGNG